MRGRFDRPVKLHQYGCQMKPRRYHLRVELHGPRKLRLRCGPLLFLRQQRAERVVQRRALRSGSHSHTQTIKRDSPLPFFGQHLRIADLNLRRQGRILCRQFLKQPRRLRRMS